VLQFVLSSFGCSVWRGSVLYNGQIQKTEVEFQGILANFGALLCWIREEFHHGYYTKVKEHRLVYDFD
jgi:hypothetical protein